MEPLPATYVLAIDSNKTVDVACRQLFTLTCSHWRW